jgi:MFS family permease
MAVFVFNVSLSFIYPLLANHLKHGYDQGEGVIGLLFMICSLSYAVFAPIATHIRMEKAVIIGMGVFTTSISMLLLGPWPTLNLPHNFWMVVAALVTFGAGLAMTYALTLPSMI